MPNNRSRKKKGGYGTPEVILEILNRRKGISRPSSGTRYFFSEKTNELFPKSIPKNNDSVQVELEPLPEACKNNFLIDVEVDVESGNLTRKSWVPKHKFYIGQIVTFFTADMTYNYQILASDQKNVGLFSLISKDRVTKQPGVSYRTTKNGKK